MGNTNTAHNNSQEKNKMVTGIVRTTAKGMGFVRTEDYEQDIVIEPEFLNAALNNDEVEVQVTGKYFKVKRGIPGRPVATSKEEGDFEQFSGQITKILKRSKMSFVGVLINKGEEFWLLPDDKKMYVQIKVTGENLKENLGKKVLVDITRFEKNDPFPIGTLSQVIGSKGDNETEIQSIILDRGIDTHFPAEVDEEANNIKRTGKPLPEDEIAKRKDFRNTFTSTIDPVDAKDFDDAISFKILPPSLSREGVGLPAQAGGGVVDIAEEELYEIGVHIADVSYYVREGTALNAEARRRGTSIYLVDRTIPMLPEVLSNDLCSLNPHEDRFAFAAVFVMDKNATVHERWFGRTVINSNKRFTYETAQEALDNSSLEYSQELTTLNTIAKKLERKNYHNGAINFETQEVKFKLDEHGRAIGVYKKPHLDTHKLVEEFMLLANREVAEYIYKTQAKKGINAGIYRIHDLPAADRLEELSLFIKALGYDLPVRQGKISSQEINKLLATIKGSKEELLIKTATIRSMAKAVYSPKNIGHYGLAFEYYTHFTSPIRRYPDLVVHRILQNVLDNNDKKMKEEFVMLEGIANHSTEREIAAAEAERASIKYKQVEYMSSHVGEDFTGTISGVTEWGIYVEETETRCEGMISLRELGNDFFIFNKKTYSVKGERTKKEYRLGDTVKFKVMKADLDNKTLDYKLV